MKYRSILVSAIALLSITVSAQATTKLTASKANDFGIAYTLPNTIFDIIIETEMTESKPGEFANYANRYLNASDAITQPSYTAYVKSVTVVPRGVPNEDNRWLMEFKNNALIYVMLDEAGVPVSINTDEVYDYPAYEIPTPVKAGPTALETEAAKQAVTQDMINSTSMSKRAQLTAQRIFDLRERRSDLISGDADNTPPDGRSMQLMLDNLSAQEAALTAMFVGTTKTWTQVQTLTYVPDGTDVNDFVLARISPVKGLVGAEDLSGKPIYLSVDILTTGELPTDSNGNPKKAPKDGVAYNIPGTAQLTITYDGAQLSSNEYELAQLGKTFFLDPKIFTDKKAPAFLIFNPVTGGISVLGTRTN